MTDGRSNTGERIAGGRNDGPVMLDGEMLETVMLAVVVLERS